MSSPTTPADALRPAPALPQGPAKNLLEVAADEGCFRTFGEAVERSGLTQTLSGPGPFTVFIPTDAAFEKLPEGFLESLFLPENKPRLGELLGYHIIPKRKTVAEFERWDSLKTLYGRLLAIQSVNRQVIVGIGKVTLPNLYANNAAVHGIDRVNLLPATR